MDVYLERAFSAAIRTISWYVKPFLEEHLSREDHIKHLAITAIGAIAIALVQRRMPISLKTRIEYNMLYALAFTFLGRTIIRHRATQREVVRLENRPPTAGTGEAPETL